LPRCSVKKVNYLAGDLQLRDIAVEVDPIQAFEVQDDVTVQDFVDVDHLRHQPPPAIRVRRCFTAS